MRWIVVGPASLTPREHGGDGVALLGDALDGGRGAVEPLEHPGLDLGGHVRVERAGAERRGAARRAPRRPSRRAGRPRRRSRRRPRRRAGRPRRAGRARWPGPSTSRRPSWPRSPAASPTVMGSPSSEPSIAPSRAATSALPWRRSARCSSRSGLSPVVARRKSLRIDALAADHRAVRLLALQRAPGAHDHRLGVGLGDEAQGLAGRVVGDELQEQPADPPVARGRRRPRRRRAGRSRRARGRRAAGAAPRGPAGSAPRRPRRRTTR